MDFVKTLCPICEQDDIRYFETSDDMTLVRCNKCGLIYVNPRLSDEERLRHFATEYMDNDQVLSDAFGNRRAVTLLQEAERVKKRHAGGRILDIGCAGGAFLSNFSGDERWQLYGIEISMYAAQKAAEKYKINVFSGELYDAGYDDEFFDVITVLDTFMYVPHPNRFLTEIRRILKDDGTLLIELPGYHFRLMKNRGLICRMLYGKWARLNPTIHLYYYNDRTLSMLLSRVGFKIDCIYPQAPSLYGSKLRRAMLWTYYMFIRGLYALSMGKVNLASKVTYLISKQNVSDNPARATKHA